MPTTTFCGTDPHYVNKVDTDTYIVLLTVQLPFVFNMSADADSLTYTRFHLIVPNTPCTPAYAPKVRSDRNRPAQPCDQGHVELLSAAAPTPPLRLLPSQSTAAASERVGGGHGRG